MNSMVTYLLISCPSFPTLSRCTAHTNSLSVGVVKSSQILHHDDGDTITTRSEYIYHHLMPSGHATRYLPPLFLNFVMLFGNPALKYTYASLILASLPCIYILCHNLLIQIFRPSMSWYPTILFVLDESK